MPRVLPRIALLAALAGMSACIIVGENTTITSESDGDTGGECPDPNSYYEAGSCFCNPGYLFCTADLDDLSCCAEDGTSSEPPTGSGTSTTAVDPTTGPGTSSTTDPDTTTEAVTSTETTDSTTTGTSSTTDDTSSTTGAELCTGPQPPPDTCTEGQYWCTNPEICGPEGSELYRCQNGAWVLDTGTADDSCTFDGYDFAYGCIDDGQSVILLCGEGPGSACDNTEPSTCATDVLLNQCTYGKLTEFDCFIQCTEVGDGMRIFDDGECGEIEGQFLCVCCNLDDPGCGE